MTREVLHSDIVFARELLDAGCEQSGIVARLSLRGVEQESATQLVESLMHGDRVSLPITDPGCRIRRHRSGYRRAHSHHGHHKHKQRRRDAALALPIYSSHRPGRRRRLRWYISRAFAAGLGVLGLLCLCYVLYFGLRAIPWSTPELADQSLLQYRARTRALPAYMINLETLQSLTGPTSPDPQSDFPYGFK